MLWRSLVALAAGLVVGWIALVVVLWRSAPSAIGLSDAIRLLPDLLRLVPRLARDASVPRGVRVRLWILLVYLAFPFDIVPDFLPVIGYADDAVLVALVLRFTVKHAGVDAISRHWPGTADGLAALLRITGASAT